MSLAHGAEGGPNFEALILALPMVVVGVILFVQKSARPIVPILLVLGGIAIGVGSLTIFAKDDHDATASSGNSNETYVAAVTGLCAAHHAASTDADEARRIFQDDAHVPLHDVAAEVQETDRAAAAALLEAKETVESDVEDESVDGAALESDLEDLLDATVLALRAIDVEAPTC